ncbi:MAG: penicillin-binding transpeptidase domain-containing protein [Gammaproteobacteria bacterium]|nr:penicillin-binding transpeptidase domain-containing protein [Gammaproteobacteria bacterium]
MKRKTTKPQFQGRHWFVLGLLTVFLGLLGARALYLQIFAADYLKAQGNARYLRVVKAAPNRGMILDRNGEVLAVSTPVDSVWAHPATFLAEGHSVSKLAKLLNMSKAKIRKLCRENEHREFVYLKRHLAPELANQVMQLQIPGVDVVREYRRYYPAGPVTSHVLGLANIDDHGQEGIELAFERHLSGVEGKTRVLRDRVGHIVEHVERISSAVDGKNLRISIDARIQYLAFRHLKAAVREHRAAGGSAVMVDVKTGEILAMVNEPSFNPNNRRDRNRDKFRNRAVVDQFEPGSTIKPFTVAMALESGKFGPDSRVDTAPGIYRIGRHRVRDARDYGLLTVTKVLAKSSNIGAAKIAMSLEAESLVSTLRQLGFGKLTRAGLPGEAVGSLPKRQRWRPIEHATLSFGYGLSSTALQLARSYTTFATDGRLLPLSVVPVQERPAGVRVFEARIVNQIRPMLELAVGEHGTGKRAQLEQYRVAGKTGTVHKLVNGEYADDRYMSAFAGMAPVDRPRVVMVVVVDDPRGEEYYGGAVAAPVFARVMSGALRILNVAPDRPVPPLMQQAKAPGADA